MNKKSKTNGFTLVELIIVMAIFGIIMLAVMRIADPLARVMERSSVKERSAAYVDNIGDYLDKSMRYSKYLLVYEGELSDYSEEKLYKDDQPVETISGNDDLAEIFVGAFFDNCVGRDGKTPMHGKLHVINVINQDSYVSGDTSVSVTVDGVDEDIEPGQVWETVYDFTCGETYQKTEGESTKTIIADPPTISMDSSPKMVVNPEHLENYGFYYGFGYSDFNSIPESDAKDLGLTFSSDRDTYYHLVPNDITIENDRLALSIVAYQKGNIDYKGGDAYFKSPAYMNTISMYLINADRSSDYALAYDYAIMHNNDGGKITPEGESYFSVTPIDETKKKKADFQKYPLVEGTPLSTNNLTFIYVVPSELYLPVEEGE